jgi:hypothetical protein
MVVAWLRATPEMLNCFSRDFLNVRERAQKIAKDEVLDHRGMIEYVARPRTASTSVTSLD